MDDTCMLTKQASEDLVKRGELGLLARLKDDMTSTGSVPEEKATM